MGAIIDGKALAQELEKPLKEKKQKFDGRIKVVSFLIGDDPASILYTNMKKDKAKELGIDFIVRQFNSETSWDVVTTELENFNKDISMHGVMVQLPLPKEFLGPHHSHELLELIDPKKDIDGLNPRDSNFIPATVKGVLSILDSLKVDYQKNIFGVVGSEGEVGKSLVYELTQRDSVVIKVDKKLPETNLSDIKGADVVVSAAGVKNLIKEEHIKNGVILIDVGLGDFDAKTYKKAKAYTPKIGGVGPMTVISLIENIYEAVSKIMNYE